MKKKPDDYGVNDLLKDLNPQQEKAVTMPFNRHCLILAGAGCGKTSVLTRRIAFCAQTHCTQDKILALTFTHKAAEEMKARVLKLPGINKNSELPVVTTFHGYGLRILRDTVNGVKNFKRLGYTVEPKLLTEDQRIRLLAEVSNPEQRRSLGMNITDLDDMLARQEVNPQKGMKLPETTKAVLKKVAEDFLRVKTEKNYWEFSDMIKQALTLLEKYHDIKSHYANKFSYILVDEFQDTNPLQITMLHSLFTPENSVFAVGDDDQAIYGFRGADIGPIMNFTIHFPNADIVKLEINYRSTPSILKTANRIFTEKQIQFRKVLVSGRYTGKRVFPGANPKKYFFPDSSRMTAWIIDTARSIEKDEGILISDMAVLFRLNETLDTTREMMTRTLGADTILPKFMTVHGSKGLEFPVVFLCDLEESIFPHYRKRKSHQINTWADLFISLFHKREQSVIDCDFDEEKRLFYVGVTRAERLLYLICVKEKVSHGRKVRLKPSRFLRLV